MIYALPFRRSEAINNSTISKSRLQRVLNSFMYLSTIAWFLCSVPLSSMAQTNCLPTASDTEGPFYKPDVPTRNSTGRGLTVKGKVRSAGSCAVIPEARVEWWQANPSGRYDDAHRGAQITSSDGSYRFETDVPPAYYFRPPHIHFKIFAQGHKTLTTQVYPQEGKDSIEFDVILTKE